MSETTVESTTDTPTIASPTNMDELKPKMKVVGTVQRLELYGAFIDIGVGTNALIHISQLGKEHVNRIADILNVGDEVEVWVNKVDAQRNQVMVTMIEPLAVEWEDLKVGQTYSGRVSRLENFGAFIDIGAEREGLVHISELSHDYVKHPSEILKADDEVQVKVLGFSKRKRRIDLSIKALVDKPESEEPEVITNDYGKATAVDLEEEDEEELPTAMEIALRRAMGDQYDFKSRRQKGGGKRRRRREKIRAVQEDIINRTLHTQDV